jgi:hypothetical protein
VSTCEGTRPAVLHDHRGLRLDLDYADCRYAGCVRFGQGDGSPWHLPAEAGPLAEFCAAVYAAAGKHAPLVLDRPEHPRASVVIAGATFSLRPGGVEEFRVHGGTQSGTLHDPAEVRELGIALAVLAEEAAAPGPHPDDIAALAGHLARRRAQARGYSDVDAAEDALRWAAGKQQRGGTP